MEPGSRPCSLAAMSSTVSPFARVTNAYEDVTRFGSRDQTVRIADLSLL